MTDGSDQKYVTDEWDKWCESFQKCVTNESNQRCVTYEFDQRCVIMSQIRGVYNIM